MIRRLYIKDFAIIKQLAINIKNGLTVITGETGAGKSIILKSLGIVLGGKPDKIDVRSGQDKAVVEAELIVDGQEKIFRRLIYKSGRARSFIDDEPIIEMDFRNSVLSLADFHGQHEQQYIMDVSTHINFLDSFCNSEDLVKNIGNTFSESSQMIQDLGQAIELQTDAANRKELLQFQIQEIQSINPQIDEDIILGKEFKRLNHVEELVSTVQNLNQSLTEHDHSIYQQLASALNELNRLSKYDDSLKPYIESIDQASISIQDASAGMIQYVESFELDQDHLQKVEERLYAIESLKRKYGGSIASVQSFIHEAENEMNQLKGLDSKIVDLELEKELLITRYQKLADQINAIRTKFSLKIASQIETEMVQLNMAGSKFEVRIHQQEDSQSAIQFQNKLVKYGEKGYDQVEFFLSANPGEPPRPLTKVASGGEVSRIMLAIKSVLKKSDPVETLVFDEIDSGLSGQAADKVAEALLKLSKDKQVICITHLPQIALRANHHLYIQKKTINEQTSVNAVYLDNKEKVQAIAELFSGERVTEEGLTSTKKFMDQALG